jgi:hypothetical protein
MNYLRLGDYRGWTIKWDPRSHKMFATQGGLFGGHHDFGERPNDRETAFAVARAWIDGR